MNLKLANDNLPFTTNGEENLLYALERAELIHIADYVRTKRDEYASELEEVREELDQEVSDHHATASLLNDRDEEIDQLKDDLKVATTETKTLKELRAKILALLADIQ